MTPEESLVHRPFLKRIPLFRELSAEDLDTVSARLKPLSLPRGATLFHQGDAADSFYIITSGHVALSTERRGEKRLSGYIGRGDTLGELSLLTGEPRPFTAILDSTTEFLVLSKSDFAKILRETPAILLQLSRTLSARLLQETHSRGEGPGLRPQVIALLPAVEEEDRLIFSLQFAISLVEQSRKRVVLIDMHPAGGSLARAAGLQSVAVTEKMLHGKDLREIKVLARFVATHVSGLGIVTLPPATLSGRLYRSIFLFINLLREVSDFAVISLRGPLSDVEKAVLYECDRWMLLGCDARVDEFLRVRSELAGFSPDPLRLVEVWLGRPAPDPIAVSMPAEWVRISWYDEAARDLRAGKSVFQILDAFPRSRRGIESLARRCARLRVGVALGTGAALGYALIGVVKALERERIPIDIVAGTSMGSLVGGLFALGLTPAEIEDLAVSVDKAWVYENLFWDLTVPRAGFFSGTTLLRFIRSYFGEKEFRELDIPFACVATDIETGEEIVFREGKIAEAIRASCGIPMIFNPLPFQGRFLVDGGLVDPVPIKIVNQLGADITIAVNLTMPAGERKTALRKRKAAGASLMSMDLGQLRDLTLPKALQSPNMLQILFQTIYTMEYEIAKTRMNAAHVNIHPDLSAFSWTELHRAREIIDAGSEMVDTVLPKIKALLPFFADSCRTDLRRNQW